MTEKIVYQIDEDGVYIGPVYADPSPLEPGVWLIPARCVEVPPPEIPKGMLAVWMAEEWYLIEDLTGITVYSTRDGSVRALRRLEEVPRGYTRLCPGPYQVWKDSAWVDDVPAVLTHLHAQKVAEIDAACENALVNGFVTQTGGVMYFYGNTLEDHLNLLSLVTLGEGSPYPCRRSGESWGQVPHTHAQLKRVLRELVRRKLSIRERAQSLKRLLDHYLRTEDRERMSTLSWNTPLPHTPS